MVVLLAVIFVVVPIMEIAVIIVVSSVIGATATLLIVILFCAAGAWVVKHEGLAAIGRVQTGFREGRLPTTEVIDAFLVLVAGFLLLIPGFITSICGLVLLVVPARIAAGQSLLTTMTIRIARRFPTTAGTPAGGFTAAGPTPGPRFYRRPDEEDVATPRPGAPSWAGRVPSDPDGPGDVIDVEGEEIILPFGPPGELDRPS